MSKLIDSLERLSEGKAQPLGFGAALAREKVAQMMLIASIPAGDTALITKARSAGVDAANNTAGPMAGLVVAAVSDISNKAAEAEQVKAADLLKSMSGNLSYVDELSAKVMPLMATKLGTVYDPGKLQILEADVPIEGDGGYFEVTDLHADLVVVVEVSNLVLTEKPSAGGLI